MPFNQQINSNLVDSNDTQAKRGIFRNRTHTPLTVRSKLSSNSIPMKPNRNKFQAKIMNRRDPPTESDVKMRRSQPITVKEVASKVVERPSVQLFEENYLTTESKVDKFASKKNGVDASIMDSQDVKVNAVQSLLLCIEHSQVDRTTISLSQTLLTNSSNLNEPNEKVIPCIMPTQQPSKCDVTDKCSIYHQNGSMSSFHCNTKLFDKPRLKKFNTFIKDDLQNDPYKMLKKSLSSTIVMPANVTEPIKKPFEDDATTVVDLEMGDTIEVSSGHKPRDLLETELKTYHENLKTYDQRAKDVIEKFTESLNDKSKIIRQYEQELSLFNNKVCDLQRQLEESLDRTKNLQSTMPTPTSNCYVSENADELKSENEKLRERIKRLETKLAKRDHHIFNLKEVLSLETSKIKELNKAQEEINKLQRDGINKSREITVLRDELQYAANMRQELVNEYDEKIVKLKRLLAIREYLLIKGKSQVT